MTNIKQTTASVEGIVPVMLTPFDDAGAIDYTGLERLIEWYIAHGSDALFAVAQSSEMQFLTLAERGALGRFVVEKVAGRMPVVVSGHISDDPDAQAEELSVAASTGAQGVVLVTNRLDPDREEPTRSPRTSNGSSRACRPICRSVCTNVRRRIGVCFPTTS